MGGEQGSGESSAAAASAPAVGGETAAASSSQAGEVAAPAPAAESAPPAAVAEAAPAPAIAETTTVSETPAVEPTTDISLGFGGGLEAEPSDATASIWEPPPVETSPDETQVVEEPKPQENVPELWTSDPEPVETTGATAIEEEPVQEPIPEATPETGLTDGGLWDASPDDEVPSENPVIEPTEEQEADSSSVWTAEVEPQQDVSTETEETEPEPQQETDFKTEPLWETEDGSSDEDSDNVLGQSAAGEEVDAVGIWDEAGDSTGHDEPGKQPQETVAVEQSEPTETPEAGIGLFAQEQSKIELNAGDESQEGGLLQATEVSTEEATEETQGATEQEHEITPTKENLIEISHHLSTFLDEDMPHDVPNDVMYSRLTSALEEGRSLIGVDAKFYEHELIESNLMDQGMGDREAHLETLRRQGIEYRKGYEQELYHSEAQEEMKVEE